MGVYTKAFVVLIGGLVGGSVGFYYQAKEDTRLRELRRMKMEEMRRINEGLQTDEIPQNTSEDSQNSSDITSSPRSSSL
ncbi:hypothetical protein GGI12_001233 [Dipsacomyces acuminosporus]|nr:hypothetical protein GGI12_001233 [Dipsacomyces acuminosporus]